MTNGEITPEQFAQTIAQQAMQAVPSDIPEQGAAFIGNIVFNFAKLAGEALVNEKTDPNIASQLTTFIGEWTFHKGIDLIRAQVPPQFIEQPILQKVAFAIFEVGKQGYSQNKSQEEILASIETVVQDTYKAALVELQQAGQISEAVVNSAVNQSNIDAMAKAQAEEKFEQVKEEETQKAEAEADETLKVEAKFIATAILLNNLPPAKKGKLLKILGAKAEHINKYKDPKQLSVLQNNPLVKKNLAEIKQRLYLLKRNMPTKGNTKSASLDIKIKELKQTLTKEELYELLKYERRNVIEHVCGNSGKNQVSSYISTAIYKYVKDKFAKL